MSVEAVSPENREILAYLQIWVDSFSQAIGEIAGVPFATVLSSEAPPDNPSATPSDLWVTAASRGAVWRRYS